MNRRLYALHRVLSALALLQLLAWTVSGLFFALVSISRVRGAGVPRAHLRNLPADLRVQDPVEILRRLQSLGTEMVSLELRATSAIALHLPCAPNTSAVHHPGHPWSSHRKEGTKEMSGPSPSEPLALPCERGERGCRLVVVTGGPGAGKTAVLEIARRSFCKNIAFIPEAASIVFGGGFWRRTSLVGRKAAQLAIFHVQRQMERVVLEDGESAFGLCDRGTLDGLAYWPEPEREAESFFREIGTTRAAELARYQAVIHLKTPDSTHGYNHQNPLRVEDPAEAQALDARILEAWAGHPNRIVIESSDDFLSKATAAIQAIKSNLPDCCREHPILLGS